MPCLMLCQCLVNVKSPVIKGLNSISIFTVSPKETKDFSRQWTTKSHTCKMYQDSGSETDKCTQLLLFYCVLVHQRTELKNWTSNLSDINESNLLTFPCLNQSIVPKSWSILCQQQYKFLNWLILMFLLMELTQ